MTIERILITAFILTTFALTSEMDYRDEVRARDCAPVVRPIQPSAVG